MSGGNRWRNRISRYFMILGGSFVGSALTRSRISGCFNTGDFVVIVIALAIYCIAELIADE